MRADSFAAERLDDEYAYHLAETAKLAAILRIEAVIGRPGYGFIALDLELLEELADILEREPCGCTGLLCPVHGDPRDTSIDSVRLA